MNILTFAAVGLIGTAFAVFMKKTGEEYSFCITLFCVSSLFIAATPYISELLSQIMSLVKLSGTDVNNFTFIFKALGVGYVSQFSSEICADAGETSVASKIELAGRVAIVTMTVPVVYSLIEMIEKML